MLAEGKTQKEIASHMGVAPSSVSTWLKNHRNGVVPKTEDKPTVEKKCPTCRYRDKPSKGNCNYLTITGHSRPCLVEGCTVYEKGNPVKTVAGLSL